MSKQFLTVALIWGLWSSTPPLFAAEEFIVEQHEIPTTVTISGTVVPYKEVTLSAQLPGRIEYIAGEEGDSFKEETVLVALDQTELLAQRRSAVAQWMNADSTLRHAQVQYSREWWSPNSPNKAPGGMGIPKLFDQFFTKPASDVLGQSDRILDRQTDLHAFGTQIDQARGALIQAQSQIEAIDAKLRDAVGKAPFLGVITRKLVEVGDTAQPGQPLLEFADTQYLQIEVDIPARLVPGLEKGMTFPARLDVLNTQVQVRVAQIFPIADPQRHTVKVKFDLPIGTRTGPGQYAEVEIRDFNIPPQNLVVIPRNALVWRGSLPGVYVRDGEKSKLRLLRLGNDVDAQHVSVLSGLKTGDRIEINPKPNAASSWRNGNHN